MPTFNAAEAARLARETREDHERMTQAPWKRGQLYDMTIDGPQWPICTVHLDDDRRPLIDEYTAANEDDVPAIARTRNNLASVAEQLEAATALYARLEQWAAVLDASEPHSPGRFIAAELRARLRGER